VWPGPGTVHLWLAPLDLPAGALGRLATTLSADERARAERFVFPDDRSRFVAGRGFLRDVLARYVGVPPGEVAFVYGPRGKPALAGPPGSDSPRFNLAHSGGLALCAVSGSGEVGVDLEEIRPLADAQAVARLVFTEGEQDELARSPAGQREALFFNGWTRKEAFVKAGGDGLSRPLTGILVGLAASAPGEVRRVAGAALSPAERRRWRIRTLVPAAGFVAALASGPLRRLTLWHWLPEG
jgi:4'-phosphopantetheinyl transferase